MQARYGVLAGLWLLVSCAGTSSGNPANGDGDDDDIGKLPVPTGIELVRSDAPLDEHPMLADDDATAFASGNAQFAFELYADLAAAPANENLFLSPYSISTALAMTYAGAAGKTEQEMRDTLHFDLDQPALHGAFNATLRALAGRADELPEMSTGQGFELSLVNQAWGQKGTEFLDPYLDVLAQNYGAGMYLVDFHQAEKARTLINDWVLEQTKDRVKDLLPEMAIDPDHTRLILTNAIYFKANWLFQFDPKLTDDGMFTAAGGARDVSMMHQRLEASYADGDAFEVVELPYLSPAVRMLLILPADGEFETVVQDLSSDWLAGVRSKLQTYDVTLSLPKFSFESENKLKEPLKQLGMPSAFESGIADFSGINSNDPLHIDQIYHKAFVAVDEVGTEAAAATAVVASDDSAPPPVEVSFDRPFIFLIYDQPTGQILFLGHLRDPG